MALGVWQDASEPERNPYEHWGERVKVSTDSNTMEKRLREVSFLKVYVGIKQEMTQKYM